MVAYPKVLTHALSESVFVIYYRCLCSCVTDMSCRSKLATLNEKLTTLERRVEYIEARVSTSD